MSKINVTLKQFKEGITKRAGILKRHNMIDPAERQVMRKYRRASPQEKGEPSVDLLDELFVTEETTVVEPSTEV